MLSAVRAIAIVAGSAGMKTAPRVPLTPNRIHDLVLEDLQRVETGLKTHVHSCLPLVNDINKYLHTSGGKRLRPMLLLLSSKLCGYHGDAAIELGVVVELIHVATLVHDDIIDNAHVRRGRPSVNSRWGNQVTVLMGDWLYMTSFSLALQLKNFRILDILIDITRRMVEGELLQLEQNGRASISVEQHLDICQRKTADLFSGCCRLAGVLAGVNLDQEEKMATYGHTVGMAFQLIDDLLDYTSKETILGKPVLKDLEEGKVTLPIIHLMQRASRPEQAFVNEVLASGDFSIENKKKIMALVHRYGTLEPLIDLANQYAFKARSCLAEFPDSVYRDALLGIPDLVIHRKK